MCCVDWMKQNRRLRVTEPRAPIVILLAMAGCALPSRLFTAEVIETATPLLSLNTVVQNQVLETLAHSGISVMGVPLNAI